MNPYAKLSDSALAEFERLEALGIRLTPEEVVTINALAHQCADAESVRGLSRGIPVPCGGAILWPLTLAAMDWLDRMAEAAGKTAPDGLTAYAMAHAYSDGPEFTQEWPEARKAVKRWLHTLRCTERELAVCVDRILVQMESPEQPPDPKEAGFSGLGELSAVLAATCGGRPEIWERHCSSAFALRLLLYKLQQNADKKQQHQFDPRMKAELALAYYTARIEKRHAESFAPDSANGAQPPDLPMPGKNTPDLPDLGKSGQHPASGGLPIPGKIPPILPILGKSPDPAAAPPPTVTIEFPDGVTIIKPASPPPE